MIRNEFICFFGDGAITRKKNDGNFASCATCNDAVLHHFLGDDTPSPNKTINSFLNSIMRVFVNFVSRLSQVDHQIGALCRD
jgi:hypothetical protein